MEFSQTELRVIRLIGKEKDQIKNIAVALGKSEKQITSNACAVKKNGINNLFLRKDST